MLVPADFAVPTSFEGPGFRLEPLGPAHNERDHEAWMSSIDHVRTTPGMEGRSWPVPMTLEENLDDLDGHAAEFAARSGFAYSILDGDEVIGCLYIDPCRHGSHDADVRSWVRANRAEMDVEVWRAVSRWLAAEWPFAVVEYAARG